MFGGPGWLASGKAGERVGGARVFGRYDYSVADILILSAKRRNLQVFVWFSFPPPMFLLLLLLAPLPTFANNFIIMLCDLVLFAHPHPALSASFFWLCLGLSVLTFIACLQSMSERHEVYASVKHAGGNMQDPLIKLLASKLRCFSLLFFLESQTSIELD